jgi:hypothetical protein
MGKQPTKELWTVGPTRYTREEHTFRSVKERSQDHYYGYRERASTTTQTLEATFDVVIDVNAIIDLIVRRAKHNRTGKANLMDGLATAKRRGKPTVIDTKTVEHPLRAGTVILQEKVDE